MSLINKMLVDLEDRQASLAGEQDLALQGITSVNDPVFYKNTDNKLKLYLFSLTGLVLLALLINVMYQYLDGKKEYNIVSTDAEVIKQDVLPEKPALPVMSVGSTHQAAEVKPAPDSHSEIIDSSFSLKLDTVLTTPSVERMKEFEVRTVPEPIDSVLTASAKSLVSQELSISGFKLHSYQDRTTFRIALSAEPEYRVYALPGPERVVVEINNIQNKLALPRVENTQLVERVRARYQGKQRALIVLDMLNPSSVLGSKVVPTTTGYELVIDARSEAVNNTTMVDEPSDRELDRQLQEYGIAAVTEQETQKKPDNGRMVKRTRTATDYYKDGLQAYRVGNNADAASLLFETITIDPAHIEARSTLISLMMEEGNRFKASALLLEGLKIYPGEYDWAKTQAHIFVEQGKLDAAVLILQKKPPALSEDLEYHALLAALLQQQGNHEVAADFYRRLLDRKANNGVWWMGLGISLQALAKNSDAGLAYRRALRDPALTSELRNYIAKQISQL